MERLARLHTLLYATLPYDTRVRLAVAGILAMMRTDWYRASLNDSLREEFEKGGIPLDEDFDFFEIVHQAVTDRINPHEPDYEDFFQDVVTNLLNRRKSQGLRKEWIRDAKRLMKRGELDNLVGLLKTAAKNFVRDMFRSRETSRGREERIKTPGEEDEPGVDITRRDLGESESEISRTWSVPVRSTVPSSATCAIPAARRSSRSWLRRASWASSPARVCLTWPVLWAPRRRWRPTTGTGCSSPICYVP